MPTEVWKETQTFWKSRAGQSGPVTLSILCMGLMALGSGLLPDAHADLAPPPKSKAVKANIRMILVAKKGQKVAKLEVPRKLLGKMQAMATRKGDAGSGTFIFPLNPAAGAMVLALAGVCALVWYVHRRRLLSNIQRRRLVLAGMVPLFAMALSIQAFADRLSPRPAKPVLQSLRLNGLALKGSIVLEVVEKGVALRLIASPEALRDLLKASSKNVKK